MRKLKNALKTKILIFFYQLVRKKDMNLLFALIMILNYGLMD